MTFKEKWYQNLYKEFDMGLDNGVVLKTKFPVNIPHPPFDWRNGPDEHEVCYWRKFWGLRNIIVTEFHQKEECADIPLDAERVGRLRCILEEFQDREYYGDNADSIWDYEEDLIRNIKYCENLSWLQNFLEEHPNEECYFYDSY